MQGQTQVPKTITSVFKSKTQREMTTTLKIDNLLYEELVLLQEILWYIDNDTEYTSLLNKEDSETFSTLYDKVINA